MNPSKIMLHPEQACKFASIFQLCCALFGTFRDGLVIREIVLLKKLTFALDSLKKSKKSPFEANGVSRLRLFRKDDTSAGMIY